MKIVVCYQFLLMDGTYIIMKGEEEGPTRKDILEEAARVLAEQCEEYKFIYVEDTPTGTSAILPTREIKRVHISEGTPADGRVGGRDGQYQAAKDLRGNGNEW